MSNFSLSELAWRYIPETVVTTRTCPWRRERGARFMTISTWRPSNVKNCMSRLVEKPEAAEQ